MAIDIDKFKEELIQELDSDKDEDRLKIKKMLDLPFRIYACLEDVALNEDGDMVITISKDNKYKLDEYFDKLKSMKNKGVYIYLDIGDWS